MKRNMCQTSPPSYYWDFFAGLAEDGESLSHALEAMLIKNFGYISGKIEPEIFYWKWKNNLVSIDNHFFPVRWDIEELALLNDDQRMRWFGLEDFIEYKLSPAVYENFSHIFEFLKKKYTFELKNIENILLKFNNLEKKNDRVFYAKKNPIGLSRQQIFLLKEFALLKKNKVFRVCLHINDQSDIHEMLMIHVTRTSMGPLKQNKTSLSYHIIEGSLIVKIHNNSRVVLKEYRICKDDGYISLRLHADEYRSIHTDSPYAIFMEVASGPFKDSDTLWLV